MSAQPNRNTLFNINFKPVKVLDGYPVPFNQKQLNAFPGSVTPYPASVLLEHHMPDKLTKIIYTFNISIYCFFCSVPGKHHRPATQQHNGRQDPRRPTRMINSAAKLIFIIMLIWFRLSSDNWVNSTSWQHNALLHSDSHPCSLNSLCQCTNLPNETYLLEISCHEVSLYKFPGKFLQLKFVNNKLYPETGANVDWFEWDAMVNSRSRHRNAV